MSNQLDDDLRNIVAAFFGANVHHLLAEPERLEAIARLARIPPERVPAVRDALTKASALSLSS